MNISPSNRIANTREALSQMAWRADEEKCRYLRHYEIAIHALADVIQQVDQDEIIPIKSE
jgi:proline dehydrogenase